MKQLYFFGLLILSNHCAAQIPHTGKYSGSSEVTIYRDEATRTIVGSFATCIQAGKICCAFNFIGRYASPNQKEISIQTSWPDGPATNNPTGKIDCKSESEFTFKLNGPPEGAMACYEIDKAGEHLELLRIRPWVALKMVKSRKAYFYSEANLAHQKKAYVVMYDVVGVLSIKGKWLNVEYVTLYDDRPQTTTGWMRMDDFFSNAF